MPRTRRTFVVTFALTALSPLFADSAEAPAEVKLGERLAHETRFTHFFAKHAGGVNAPLVEGDPAVEIADATTTPLYGAFAGYSMNCRACHPADEYRAFRGNRAYADFARRSRIEAREDGRRRTVRNTPAFVDIAADPAGAVFFHYDGEFASLGELVVQTMAGRNYGWLPKEHDEALKHIVRVIREDDGSFGFPPAAGGSYASVLRGGEEVSSSLRPPEEFRVDVKKATDAEILDRVGRLVEAYMLSLRFARDEAGLYEGSPYDAFLAANGLPRRPESGESGRAYAARLLREAESLKSPKFVDEPDRVMNTFEKAKPFRFGPEALEGLKVFLRVPDPAKPRADGTGNCAACHTPPAFTDFKFHNTGATQAEYDALHGRGAFMKLAIPDLKTRSASPAKYLPASSALPEGQGPFFAIPDKKHPGLTDLGLWNVFGNPLVPKSQETLRAMLARGRPGIPDARLLEESIARFKTPTLRLLGQSDPYLHDGSRDSLTSVLHFYRESFEAAARGEIRNAAPEMTGPSLDSRDIPKLEAFLESLNEDYR